MFFALAHELGFEAAIVKERAKQHVGLASLNDIGPLQLVRTQWAAAACRARRHHTGIPAVSNCLSGITKPAYLLSIWAITIGLVPVSADPTGSCCQSGMAGPLPCYQPRKSILESGFQSAILTNHRFCDSSSLFAESLVVVRERLYSLSLVDCQHGHRQERTGGAPRRIDYPIAPWTF